ASLASPAGRQWSGSPGIVPKRLQMKVLAASMGPGHGLYTPQSGQQRPDDGPPAGREPGSATRRIWSMTLPLMPKATAVWLVENTALTFQQIADFCGLHELEVQAIADGEVATGMQGWDPVGNGQLTRDEIARCEADPAQRLRLIKATTPLPQAKGKGPRYTPISRRQDKPNAIA